MSGKASVAPPIFPPLLPELPFGQPPSGWAPLEIPVRVEAVDGLQVTIVSPGTL